MNKDCLCCGKELDLIFPRTIYCNNCSLHNKRKSMEIEILKKRVRVLTRKPLLNEMEETNDKLVY